MQYQALIACACAVLANLLVTPTHGAAVLGAASGGTTHKDDCPIAKLFQSPIDIITDDVVWNPFKQNFKKCEGSNSSHPHTVHTMVNEVHDVAIEVSGNKPCMGGGGLPEIYYLDQFHFHWGLDKEVRGDFYGAGSEHQVNGYQYPMEVHFVYHAKSQGDFSTAKEAPMGLAVMAFFIQVGKHNPWFEEIVENLDKVAHFCEDEEVVIAYNSETVLPQEDVTTLGNETFWRYYGSLTTQDGGHQESVIWTVFKRPIEIDQDQLNAFHQILDESEKHLENNFRCLQELNDRKVYTNNPDGKEGGCYDAACNYDVPSGVDNNSQERCGPDYRGNHTVCGEEPKPTFCDDDCKPCRRGHGGDDGDDDCRPCSIKCHTEPTHAPPTGPQCDDECRVCRRHNDDDNDGRKCHACSHHCVRCRDDDNDGDDCDDGDRGCNKGKKFCRRGGDD